jgi:putative peptidoglycan lipid II flippase
MRVSLTALLGYFFALVFPHWIGIHIRWGVAGLTMSAGIGGWVEFSLLRHTLNRRIGRTGLPLGLTLKLWLSAGTGAALGFGVKLLLEQWHPILMAIVVLGLYGLSYFACAALLKVSEAQSLVRQVRQLIQG